MDVEEDDVGIQLADQRHRLGHRAGFADDVDGLAELAAHTRAKEVVVVDEHDATAAHVCLPRRNSTSVPSGDDVSVAVPPARSMRPRIDSAIPCAFAGSLLGIEAAAPVADEDRDLVLADVDEGRDLVCAGVPRRVRHRLAGGEDERLHPIVDGHVARADELDRDAVQLLDLGGGGVHRWRRARRLRPLRGSG